MSSAAVAPELLLELTGSADVVRFVRDLHRHRAGYITIGKYRPDAMGEETFSHVLCVRPSDLEQMLPDLVGALFAGRRGQHQRLRSAS